jgi:hypothetical protein
MPFDHFETVPGDRVDLEFVCVLASDRRGSSGNRGGTAALTNLILLS